MFRVIFQIKSGMPLYTTPNALRFF